MTGFFKELSNLNPNHDNRVLTVIDGSFRGEKMLVSNQECVWRSEPEGFFASHPEWTKSFETGLLEADGIRIYAEQLTGGMKIVICGAGHVGLAIAKICDMIGCDVTIIDDRVSFTDRAESAGFHAVCDEFEPALDRLEGDRNTWFVIVTRGHKWDKACLRVIAQKPHAYIGLMGSRRRVKMVMQSLVEEGVDEQVLSRVFTPVGLPIGAETPEEIAVSVAAEIIREKYRNSSGQNSGYSKEILEAIRGDQHGDSDTNKGVLMTIVHRTGSAPRAAGAKMVLLEDGITTAGTIGGGRGEADTLNKAREMLQNPDVSAELFRVSMNAQEAEEEGMVCGGSVEILLEKI